MVSTTSTRGSVPLETIAIITVIILVSAVMFAILLIPKGSTNTTIKPPVDTLPQRQMEEKAQFELGDMPDNPVYSPPGEADAPFNVKLFDEQRTQLLKQSSGGEVGGVNSARYTIQVERVDTADGLRITGTSKQNKLVDGFPVVFAYTPAQVAKVSYGPNVLSPGNIVNIDETFDYAKATYDESLQSVTITVAVP